MQDILSFVQAQSPLTLAPSTAESITPTSTNGSFSESFFSIILGEFTQENQSILDTDVPQELPTLSFNEETLDLTSSNDEAKSIDEHLLDDLLGVVNALQQNAQTTVFPTLKASSTLEKILGSETARQDFANVKSVSDLMDLSKKYNLGLEKLSITQESIDSLQTKFPTLAQNNFFDDLQTALDTAKSSFQSNDTQLQRTTTNTLTMLDKQPPKTETSPTSSLLSELMSKENKPEPKSDAPIITTPDDVLIEKPITVNEKQQTTQTQSLLKEETTQKSTAPLETILQKAVNTNETKKPEKVVPVEVADVSIEEETLKTTRVNEFKIENPETREDISDAVLKTIKPEKTVDEAADEMLKIPTTVTHDETNTDATVEDTPSTLDVKTDMKSTPKQDISPKTVPVKESLNQFASDLKEKIETYKPPIMKVELSLSPKNLGDVDVTLLTRGNNLHVNISSNTNTMSLFTQNQADVKNALVNMGFTNLEMNFSDQSNKEQSQQDKHKPTNGNFEEFNEEDTALFEIVIPQYV